MNSPVPVKFIEATPLGGPGQLVALPKSGYPRPDNGFPFPSFHRVENVNLKSQAAIVKFYNVFSKLYDIAVECGSDYANYSKKFKEKSGGVLNKFTQGIIACYFTYRNIETQFFKVHISMHIV